MNILGLSFFYHDSSAALVQNGKLIAASAEERFSRVKHDFEFPLHAIDFCLKQANISLKDIDYVIFYEKPFVKFERILLSTLDNFPKSYGSFRESMITWFKDKLWLKNIISEKLEIDLNKVLFCHHHISHAASAFLCSPFESAAILTVDGVGEWATTTFASGKGNRIEMFKEIRFPDSLGLLYSTFTAFLGFEVNEGEYKVMGMAPYGKPKYIDKINKIIKIQEDGSFKMDMSYFAYQYSLDKSYSGKFVKEFGKPRSSDGSQNLEEYYCDIAASIQTVTENVLVNLCRGLYKLNPSRNLCMAGGVALNCVANKKILEETDFKEIYIQPSAGDGGAALGAALYLENHILKNKRNFIMEHAYWGKEYSNDEIRAYLTSNSIKYQEHSDVNKMLKVVAAHIYEGKVIGWFQGRGEWGPRALGNRSILADPRNPKMKDIINNKIKFREPFRPFAPAVLYESAAEYFEFNGDINQFPYKFMLYTSIVRENKRAVIPAVTHENGTARLQIVENKTNPLFYGLIKEFGSITGVPVLLNTSYNLKGEPIVNSPENAINTFNNSGLDMVVLGNNIVFKQ